MGENKPLTTSECDEHRGFVSHMEDSEEAAISVGTLRSLLRAARAMAALEENAGWTLVTYGPGRVLGATIRNAVDTMYKAAPTVVEAIESALASEKE